MGFDKRELIPIVFILVMFSAAIYLYPITEEPMATHWGPSGEADGYGSRFMGLLFLPIMVALLYGVLSLIPRIAVYKKNIMKFYNYYFWFKVVFVIFFGAVYAATIAYNRWKVFNMSYFVMPAVAVLFFYAGVIMKHAKRNFFIGIRTPWTLSNEKIWEKTHKLGYKLFYALAGLMVIITFLEYKIWILLISVISVVVFLFVYSYVLYQKVTRKRQ